MTTTPRDRYLLERADRDGDRDHILMWHAGSVALCGWDRDCLLDDYLDDLRDDGRTGDWTPSEGVETLDEHLDDWHDYITNYDGVYPQHVERYTHDDGDLDERCARCGRTARTNLTEHLANREDAR